jgi:hypothetical protein
MTMSDSSSKEVLVHFYIFSTTLASDPVFIYTASAAVARLRLSAWVEPMAGLYRIRRTF